MQYRRSLLDASVRSDVPNVYVYPSFNAGYYSQYVAGLRHLLGRPQIHYSTRRFPPFGSDCLAIQLQNPEMRIYLHANDMPELSEEGLAWSDVFGKVNLDRDLVPEEHRGKVIALGPTFPVRVWGGVVAEARALTNYALSPRTAEPLRKHIANYRGQYKSRFPEHEYAPSDSDPNYIFFNAAVWEREPKANAIRARFVEAAQQVKGVEFEGGLTPRKSARGSDLFDGADFAPFLAKRYSTSEYLAKSRASAVALNNPAYRSCHSWRLAEYLALGKAIISTPIVRELPAQLEHGIHIHYVDGSVEDFKVAIEEICSNDAYRRSLELNARKYYDAYLSPSSVMRRVLHHAGLVLS